ncbi:hypothetical protein GCM10027405_02970 [Arthrobacter alkaliphilus]
MHDDACFGELSANILAQRGAAAVVIDGAVRDVIGINQTPLPVFARAVTPRNYHPFGQPYGSINLPVTCGGTLIYPRRRDRRRRGRRRCRAVAHCRRGSRGRGTDPKP